MSDVTCRLVRSHLDFLQARGRSPDDFLSLLAKDFPKDEFLHPDFLLNTANRIPWESFNDFCDTLEKFFGEPTWEKEFIESSISIDGVWIPYTSAVMGLLSSPLQAYRLVNNLLGPTTFGNVIIPFMEVLEDGRIHIRLRIAAGRRDSPLFFRMSSYGFANIPRLLGLSAAIVEMKLVPMMADFYITAPASRSIWARATRAMRMFFAADGILDELSKQDRLLRQNYQALLLTTTELRKTQAELESRVEQRTRELKTTNERLQDQIADVLRKEEENRQLHERLVHLQKLEAVGTLAGGISHEINNVLHGIYLSLDLAERHLPGDHTALDKVLTAKKFASRGRDLMQQVLAFSRKAKSDHRPVLLTEAIKEAVKLMRSTLPKNIEIAEDYSAVQDRPVHVRGDFTQLQQVIINLCSNAAYAMRIDGGRISIAIETCPAANGLRASQGIEDVVVRVVDTGEGIPEEARSRIFEPFFTTKPVGEGTGMGLAVVHGIIQSHAGSIDVLPRPGGGTEFRLSFPVVRDVEEPIDDLEDPALHGGTEHLLLVDDEPDLLNLLKDTLAAFGYEVTATSDSEQAIEIFDRNANDIDLVITDFSMPKLTGVDVARRLRAIKPGVPILLCTGYSEHKSLDRAEGALVNACLTKPLDGIELNKAIRTALPPP